MTNESSPSSDKEANSQNTTSKFETPKKETSAVEMNGSDSTRETKPDTAESKDGKTLDFVLSGEIDDLLCKDTLKVFLPNSQHNESVENHEEDLIR